MRKLDHKESWALKNWWFWTVVLEKTCECPFHSKEIKPIQGNQPWIFIGRTDAEAEAPKVWPPDAKSRLIWKDPDAGKDWRQRRGQERIRCLDDITNSTDMSLSKLWEIVKNREDWCASVHGVAKRQSKLRGLTKTLVMEWVSGFL